MMSFIPLPEIKKERVMRSKSIEKAFLKLAINTSITNKKLKNRRTQRKPFDKRALISVLLTLKHIQNCNDNNL